MDLAKLIPSREESEALLAEVRPWRVVPERLRHWAKVKPDAPFVQCESPWLSFAEVDARSDRLAAGLHALGLRKGDRIAVMLPNCIEMILTFFAMSKLGAVMIPLNIYLKGEFLAHQLRDSQASIFVCDAAGWQSLLPIVGELDFLHHAVFVGPDCGEDPGGAAARLKLHEYEVVAGSTGECPAVPLTMHDLLIIMYTSGTTGPSKGCMLSHGYYMSQTWSDIKAGMLVATDVLYSAMPMFHAAAGVRQLGQALVAGVPSVFDARFSASNFMNRVVEVGATWVTLVVAMLRAVLAQPEAGDRKDHKIRWVSANAASAEDQEEFERRFGCITSSLGFGQTEGMAFTKAHLSNAIRKRGTIGHKGYFYDIQLLDDDGFPVPQGEIGEICVRPLEPQMMFSGYWRSPEKSVEAFRGLWYHTGDLGEMDEEGYFNFRGRKVDAIRRRGENVPVLEVETALGKFPAIRQAAIHPVPSELGEHEIKACLLLQPGHELDVAEFFEFMKRNLPYFAVPRYIEVMDEFPTTPATGRVQKAILREKGVANAIDFEKQGFKISVEDRRG